MRRRSITGPLILILIGVLFLTRNLWQEIPLFELSGPLLAVHSDRLGRAAAGRSADRGDARSKPLPSAAFRAAKWC